MTKEVIFLIPSMSGGGAERVISIISSYLANEDMKVTIALFKSEKIEYIVSNKVNIDTTLIGKCNGVIEKVFSFRKYLKEHKDATVISFFTQIGMYILLMSIGIKNKVIISERLDPAQSIPNSKLLFFIRRQLYKLADKFVFQTPDALEFFDEKIQKRGVVIPNPLKDNLPERFEGVRAKEIVTFARLEPQKNYPLLIDAFEIFCETYDDYVLKIYGKGTEEEKLKKLVQVKNLEHKVNFMGFNNNIHKEIVNARMFVLTSDYEGLSNSMLEAMAIGLPCVCTDCPPGGARMFINHGINGLLVPIKNKKAMALNMIKIAEDEKFGEALSQNAIKIKNELKVEQICLKWKHLINN